MKKAYWAHIPVSFDKEKDQVIGLECIHGNHMGEKRSLYFARYEKEGTVVVACETCKREFYLLPDVCP